MNSDRRANAVRFVRGQIPELPTLDSFTSDVQATIRRLYQEGDKRGSDYHNRALDLSRRFDSAKVDCQQVHEAAALFESIKSSFSGIEKSINKAEHHSRVLRVGRAKELFHGFQFGTAKDIDESAAKLVLPDGELHEKHATLSDCRLWFKQSRRETIDPAISYVTSLSKTSPFAENFVSRLSSHCRQALANPLTDDTSMTSAQKNRLRALQSLSNPRSLACGTLKEGITALRPAIDPHYPSEHWLCEEMRRFGADLTAAT